MPCSPIGPCPQPEDARRGAPNSSSQMKGPQPLDDPAFFLVRTKGETMKDSPITHTTVFLSLTELGHRYGVTSHVMGRWLVNIGLRTADLKPSEIAFNGGYVARRPSTQLNTYSYVWHAAKTIRRLQDAGYGRPRA